jgi:hypothetical protein
MTSCFMLRRIEASYLYIFIYLDRPVFTCPRELLTEIPDRRIIGIPSLWNSKKFFDREPMGNLLLELMIEEIVQTSA